MFDAGVAAAHVLLVTAEYSTYVLDCKELIQRPQRCYKVGSVREVVPRDSYSCEAGWQLRRQLTCKYQATPAERQRSLGGLLGWRALAEAAVNRTVHNADLGAEDGQDSDHDN